MPQNLPSIAVIIPVYNGENYLRETVESVLRQTYPASQVIIIDDGSTDRTAAIAHSFHPAVKVVCRANHGIPHTRNFGASLATADWLAFLDHDDLWEPENLERQLAQVALHPDAGFSYAGRTFLSRPNPDAPFTRSAAPPMPSPRDLPRVLMERCPFTPCSVMIRRDIFNSLGGFDPRHHGVEDWDLWLRVSFANVPAVCCPEPLTTYRVHHESISFNVARQYPAFHRVVRETIFPRMTPLERATRGRKVVSRIDSEFAIIMREQKNPAALSLMLRSILRHPFHAPRRYKIAAHMTLLGPR